MMSTLMFSIITVLSSLLSRSNSSSSPTREPTESPTGAFLAFPSVVDGELYHQYFPVAPAQFGYHRYGGKLEGVLVLPANETYHKECPAGSICNNECYHEPGGINPYIKYIHDWFISDNDIKNYILIIDRLDCYFVNKIEIAEQLGAAGVIICDWRVEGLFTMWMPNDWEDDINIPSVLLQNKYCQKLMRHLGVQNWDPQHPENMIYPSPEQMNWTIATIEWSLLHPDDRVEYELWTSSNDYLGSRFKHHFNTTAIDLDKANDTSFTPHMYILNGSHWGCDEMVNGTYTLNCGQQCTNNGRYCAVDPEYDLEIGLDGMDVIQENLRSLCVWEYDKVMHQGTDDIMWWDYAVLWDENCGVYANDSTNFHVNCSFAQMDKLDITKGLSNYVNNCVTNSGGYGFTDGVNSILKTETKLKYNSSIHSVPMVRVNGYLIHGNIDCPPPVTAITCQVLGAICAGFQPGTEPPVCELTPSPTIVHCNDTDKDCLGQCYGSHEIDACHKCLLVSDAIWNECIGCNGQINSTNGTYDCEGICGGHYALNPCSYCKDKRAIDFMTFGVDCRGGCDMNLKLDECGECKRESNISWNHCVGCDGVANSGQEFNECGRCIDSLRTDFDTEGKDCSGICDGPFEYDECGVCLVASSIQWNSCIGCDGVANSNKEFNMCGLCIDKNDSKFNEYGKDCSGICATDASDTYKLDSCGQCLLPTDKEFDNCCDGNINKGYNVCELCLYLNATDFNRRGKDCRGICYGGYVVDACGHCLDPISPNFDDCLNCGDNNDKQYDCNDKCDGNAHYNPCGLCIDTDSPDFETRGKDCKGTCTGNYVLDECNICLHKNSSDWNSCVGCDNKPNSNMAYNPCNFCILQIRDDFATYGKDCKSECNGNHLIDSCGRCGLTTDNDYNSCIGCDGKANSNTEKNACGVCALKTDPKYEEYGKDCTGNCATTAANTHYIDECGECLLPSDGKWNKCINEPVKSGTGDGTFGSNTILIVVISVVALILICCAFFAIFYLYKKHSEMKRNFKEILETYKPMDDIAPKQTQRTMTTVPEESD